LVARPHPMTLLLLLSGNTAFDLNPQFKGGPGGGARAYAGTSSRRYFRKYLVIAPGYYNYPQVRPGCKPLAWPMVFRATGAVPDIHREAHPPTRRCAGLPTRRPPKVATGTNSRRQFSGGLPVLYITPGAETCASTFTDPGYRPGRKRPFTAHLKAGRSRLDAPPALPDPRFSCRTTLNRPAPRSRLPATGGQARAGPPAGFFRRGPAGLAVLLRSVERAKNGQNSTCRLPSAVSRPFPLGSVTLQRPSLRPWWRAERSRVTRNQPLCPSPYNPPVAWVRS